MCHVRVRNGIVPLRRDKVLLRDVKLNKWQLFLILILIKLYLIMLAHIVQVSILLEWIALQLPRFSVCDQTLIVWVEVKPSLENFAPSERVLWDIDVVHTVGDVALGQVLDLSRHLVIHVNQLNT